MHENDKLIICKGTSGMGNRILAACTTLLYAQISGRKFWLDWRDNAYSQEQINSFPVFFDCFSQFYLEERPSELWHSSSVYPPLWCGKLDDSFGGLREELKAKGYEDMSVDVSRINYNSDVLVFCAYTHKTGRMTPLFTGKFEYFSTLTNRDLLREILRKIRLKGEIYADIQAYKEKYFGLPTVGVHVRNTDMKISSDILLRKVKSVLSNAQGEKIFLATDNRSIIDSFRDALGGRVITIDKWFAPDGGRLHQNWDQCPDRTQNGIEALTDLYLLAECDRLVFSSQSSFGFVASLLSKAREEHLYDVKQRNFVERIQDKLGASTAIR